MAEVQTEMKIFNWEFIFNDGLIARLLSVISDEPLAKRLVLFAAQMPLLTTAKG